MPFIQVHSSRNTTPATRRELGATLAELYGEAMQTNPRIVNVGFLAYETNGLARYDAEDGGPAEMTIVTCDIRTGRTPEVLEALGRSISAACAKVLGIADSRIAVYLRELEPYAIYRDGGRAPRWTPDEAAKPETPPGR